MSIAEITGRLNTLVGHGFITGWRKGGKRWVVLLANDALGPYTQHQVSAWIEGANAMGAG